MEKACWKTWALTFLCNVSLGIEYVPWGGGGGGGYLKVKFTGCTKKWFLLLIRFPNPRAAAHTHVVLSLTMRVLLGVGVQKSHLND